MTTRRRLIAGVLAAPLVARYAHAAEYSWKFAHTSPLSFPFHIRLAAAAEIIVSDPVADHAKVYQRIAAKDAEGALQEMAFLIDSSLTDTITNLGSTARRQTAVTAA